MRIFSYIIRFRFRSNRAVRQGQISVLILPVSVLQWSFNERCSLANLGDIMPQLILLPMLSSYAPLLLLTPSVFGTHSICPTGGWKGACANAIFIIEPCNLLLWPNMDLIYNSTPKLLHTLDLILLYAISSRHDAILGDILYA